MEEQTESDLFQATETGEIDKVVKIIATNGTSPTVRNKVGCGLSRITNL